MAHYSVQSVNKISVKCYGFLSFSKNMDRNITKNISTNVSCTCTQKLLDHEKWYAADALKTASKRLIQKNSRNNW